VVDDFAWHENEIMLQNVNVFSNIGVEQVKHNLAEASVDMSGCWRDQNHFTTVQYYRDLITRIGQVPRFPEGPMIEAARKVCSGGV